MNIEALELIHKLLTEHKDNASRCCDRARGKRNSTPDDDQNYERYDMKLREADKAKFAAQDAESCGDPIAVAEIYQHDAEALRAARAVLEGLEHHRAKAADVARAIRICRGEILSDDCGECPYYEDCRDGTHKLDLDIESLLVEVCLQGGDCDESTCRM